MSTRRRSARRQVSVAAGGRGSRSVFQWRWRPWRRRSPASPSPTTTSRSTRRLGSCAHRARPRPPRGTTGRCAGQLPVRRVAAPAVAAAAAAAAGAAGEGGRQRLRERADRHAAARRRRHPGRSNGTGDAINLNQAADQAGDSGNCTIVVPRNPLTAQGLATPYQLADGCSMANDGPAGVRRGDDPGAQRPGAGLQPDGHHAGHRAAARLVVPAYPRGAGIIAFGSTAPTWCSPDPARSSRPAAA